MRVYFGVRRKEFFLVIRLQVFHYCERYLHQDVGQFSQCKVVRTALFPLFLVDHFSPEAFSLKTHSSHVQQTTKIMVAVTS